MNVIEDQEFDLVHDRDSSAVYENLELRNCFFRNCFLSVTKNPALRSTVRNVRLVNCSQTNSIVFSPILENVVVDSFPSKGTLLQIWGAAFSHVELRGKIDRLMISSDVDVTGREPEYQAAFDAANTEYYETVDWAIDISQGEFRDLTLRGVPSRLVRRDPETQFVVSRADVLDSDLDDPRIIENIWYPSLQLLLRRDDPDLVLVAPKRSAKFKELLEGLTLLEQIGVAHR